MNKMKIKIIIYITCLLLFLIVELVLWHIYGWKITYVETLPIGKYLLYILGMFAMIVINYVLLYIFGKKYLKL